MVTVRPGAATLELGATIQLTAETRDASGQILTGRVVTWSSSDSIVADVSAAGVVSALTQGGPVTITATSEGRSGTATVTVVGDSVEPVASVTVSPSLPPVIVGVSAPLTAELRDANGTILAGRVVTWMSSQPDVVAVSATGVVSAVAAGGPVTITATSEAQEGSVSVTTVAGVVTGIQGIRTFLDTCPTSDPALAVIQGDFELRENGELLDTPLTCVEPYSSTPIAELTDELIAMQVLRTAYHMSAGTEGRLPWTPKSLYDWMQTNVAGINLKTAPGQLYCCDVIDGQYYISVSRQDDAQRNHKRTWMGISNSLAFYAHEIRHADPGAPGHVNGCEEFPQPTDPAGCDATYDPSNPGGYGIQLWLEASWATGFLYVGIGCAPEAIVAEYLSWHVGAVNHYRGRIVDDVPPPVTGAITYGGSCP
jgi:hypothetical protein